MRKALGTWPLPAVLAWAAAWLVFRLLLGQGAALHTALGTATALGVAFSLLGNSWWRRVLIAAGFPLSLALSLTSLGLAALPAWAWLVPLLLLLAVYPLNAWRDAPLFPTPAHALDGMPEHAQLPDGARVLILAARPIGEPVVRAGPFVMNTRAEIEQAFADYQAGLFG